MKSAGHQGTTLARAAGLYPALLLGFILPASLSGCSRRTSQHTVTVIPLNRSQEEFLTERAGMDQVASSFGMRIDAKRPGTADPQRQIDLVENAVHAGDEGIVVTPVAGTAIEMAITHAASRSIPVVVLQNRDSLPDADHLSFLLEDYDEDARLVTQRLQQLGLEHGNVLLLGLEVDAETSVHRLDALEKAFRRDLRGVTVDEPVMAPYGSGLNQIAAEHFLAVHDGPVALIALNARAAVSAITAADQRPDRPNIHILAFEQSFPLLLRMRRGRVDGLVAQNMLGMGRQALTNIHADRERKPYPHVLTLEPRMITPENLGAPCNQEWLRFTAETP